MPKPSPLGWSLLILPMLSPAAFGAADPALFNEQGLRAKHYRSPPPMSVPGAETVNTPRVLELMARDNAVLIDVLGVTVRPESRELGFAWLPNEARFSLPGAHWLPNVGYGTLDAEMERYFRTELARLTDGDHGRALVLFCVEDCWMSWNAVQRAAGYGYTNLYWYRGGTDAWEAYGGNTVAVEPIPLQPVSASPAQE